MSGALAGKFASVFVSTGTPGGGQEATVMNSLSTLSHHGIVFVPLGYKTTFPQLGNLTEVHGGTYIEQSFQLFIFTDFIAQVHPGEQVLLQAPTAPVSLPPSNWRLLLSKESGSGALFRSITSLLEFPIKGLDCHSNAMYSFLHFFVSYRRE